ncbi:MAG TPA: TonB family protein [Pyrinomonadaceae bacterium]
MLLRFLLILSLICHAADGTRAAQHVVPRDDAARRPPRVAVLDFGDTETGRRAAADVAAHLSKFAGLRLVDAAQARSAARGLGYTGSLNLTLEEARDLGAAIDCDYYLTGDAQTLRRSSSAVPVYHEAYASVFIVSARDGRLIAWQRPHAEAPTPEEAERLLAAQLADHAEVFRISMFRDEEDERARRRRESLSSPADDPPYFEDAPEEGSDASKDFVPPHPYQRVRPAYPDTAAQAEAEATVDAAVEIDERGEVIGVRVVRWGGFGLDHAVVETLRKMHFRPATRSGRAVPVRVLMRYNFRRPARPGQPQQAGEGEMKLGPAFKALLNRTP